MASKWKDKATYTKRDGVQVGVEYDFTGLKNLLASINVANNRHIKVGWFKKERHKDSGFYVGELARMQEFGADIGDDKSIPARPYFRQALPDIKRILKEQSRDVFNSVLKCKSLDYTLNTIGYESKAAFHSSVMKQNMTKLSEQTAQKKGHTFQWDDSGQMLSSFTYQVFKSSLTKADKQKESSK